MRDALTFHASFDNGPGAAFARGDKAIYTVDDQTKALTPGTGGVTTGPGRFGSALRFSAQATNVVAYKAERNVAYSPSAFNGTFSFWLSLDPSDIPGQYCDPVQITDKAYNDSCVWIDFTKNDTPSDLRLGIFGNRSEWEPNPPAQGQSESFYWRLCKVAEPPFARGKWTHVAVTWDGINSSQSGRGRLYFDGAFVGATGAIREKFAWNVADARIRLGVGKYVGSIDDVAVFSRALSADEIRELYGLKRGVGELHS